MGKVDCINFAHKIHQLRSVVFSPVVTGVAAAVNAVQPVFDVLCKKLRHIRIKTLKSQHARVYCSGRRPEKVRLRLQVWGWRNLAARKEMNELRKRASSR